MNVQTGSANPGQSEAKRLGLRTRRRRDLASSAGKAAGALLLLCVLVCAQSQPLPRNEPAPAAPAAAPVEPAPQQQPPPAVPAPPPPPPPVVYHYTGEAPIALDCVCGNAEIQEHGLSCTVDEPCSVYLELDALAAVGEKLLLAGDLHTGTATLWSVLLASDDGGATWSEPAGRLRGVSLYLLECPGEQVCYAAGHTSGGVPRDPLLLRGAIGGGNWLRLPLLEEEGAIGSIEALRFDTPERGRAQVNRGRPGALHYATLLTEDAGAHWTLAESSATRPPPVTATPASAYRFAADRSGRTLRVEKRTGAAWRTVARFSVAAGVCRAEPRMPVVEPVPPPAPTPAVPAAAPPAP
jgi:hypothetical protein